MSQVLALAGIGLLAVAALDSIGHAYGNWAGTDRG